MPELQLFSGPRLVRKTWVYDDAKGTGEHLTTDVTARAHEYLFRDVTVAPDVTLADVFELVLDEPVMQAVFRQEFVAELCGEVRKGPVTKEEEHWQQLEFLELYQVWTQDTATSEYGEVGRFHLHGVGVVQEADIFEHGHLAHKKGERTKWAVSLAPVRELLHLPVRVNFDVIVCEDDLDAKLYGKTIQTGTNKSITLGSFIREILWELSWHGSAHDSAEVSQGLKDQMAEIDAGTAKTTSHEDVFESLGFVSRKTVYAQFFVGSDAVVANEVYRALHDLEDDEPAHEGLRRLLDGKLQVRQEFAELTGRELRKAVREAQHLENESSEN
jgi:hypothetical protein